jgi:hypothetical protein
MAARAIRLSPAERSLLRDVVDRLRGAIAAEAIAGVQLFGSRARGDSHAGSDIDVAVGFRSTDDARRYRRTMSDCAFDAMWARDALDLGLAANPLGPEPPPALCGAIACDGIDLWHAPPW